MANYLVSWEIDIEDVDTPKEAAEKAFREYMNGSGSSATVFNVINTDTSEEVLVDLD